MFGPNIRRVRKIRGMTQKDLAGRVGVSRQAVCMWEQERRDIRSKMLNKIAKVLRVTMDEMMTQHRYNIKEKEVRDMKKTKCSSRIGGKKVDFELMAPEAKKVKLTGDFNFWNEDGIVLKKDRNGLWATKVNLKPGRYEYKFIVDGQWWTDPSNTDTITNTYGSLNSVKEVTA